MGINDNLRRAFFELHDLGKYMDNVEYWSHGVETRRSNAFSNYKIGQEQARRKFNAARTLARADSALFAGSFSLASEQYAKYLKYVSSPDNIVIYNAACAASMSGEASRGLDYLVALANRDSTWYLKDPLDQDLLNLTDLPEWDDFYKMISERRMNIEKNFDTSLRRRLTQIRIGSGCQASFSGSIQRSDSGHASDQSSAGGNEGNRRSKYNRDRQHTE